MRIVASHGVHVLALPPGHRFPAGKYARLSERFASERPELMRWAGRASVDDLCLVHDRAYVGRVLDGALAPDAIRRLGFPWSPSLVERSLFSVGGTLCALAWALEEGAAGHLAGGTHHAFRDRGEGFCTFNDIAVAVAVARRDHGVRRMAIVDLDVHQGNGTAALLGGDSDVFTLSLHGAKNYPFHKERSTLDVDLPDGCDDAAYLRALDEALESVHAHRPELLFYQAGVDALAGDRFGRLALSHAGLAERNRRVFALAKRLGTPIVVTLGGGYHRDLDRTVLAHAEVYRGLVEAFV